MKKNINIFMLVGLNTEDEFLQFLNLFPQKTHETRPKIRFIFNYFEPMVGTPMESFNLYNLQELNMYKLCYMYKSYSKRILAYRDTLKMVFPVFRCLLSRCNRDEAPFIWSLRKLRDVHTIFDAMCTNGMEKHIISLPHTNPVIGPYEKTKERFKKTKIYNTI
jgi:hypothetical protein